MESDCSDMAIGSEAATRGRRICNYWNQNELNASFISTPHQRLCFIFIFFLLTFVATEEKRKHSEGLVSKLRTVWAEAVVEADWLPASAPLTHVKQHALTGWIYGMLNAEANQSAALWSCAEWCHCETARVGGRGSSRKPLNDSNTVGAAAV